MRRRSVGHTMTMASEKTTVEIERVEVVDEEDQRYDWNDLQFGLIQLNKRTFWYKSIRFFLFIHDYDPYAIFKHIASVHFDTHSESGSNRRSSECATSGGLFSRVMPRQHCMSNLPKLRLSTKRYDIVRHQVGHLTRLYCVYFFVKGLILSLAQFALLKHKYLVPRGYQPPLLGKEVTQVIADYVGNPLFVLKDIAVLFYTAPIGLLVIGFVLLHMYYERFPLNIAPLRFILGPVHELKRVDSSIRRKLADIRNSLDVYEQQKQQMLMSPFNNMQFAPNANYCHLYLTSGGVGEARNQLRLERAFCAKIRGYLDEFERRMHVFRPQVYSSRYFEKSSAMMGGVVVAGHLSYIFCSTVLVSALEMPPYLDRCRAHQQQQHLSANQATAFCNPFEIFTLPEILTLIELALNFTLGYCVSALNLILYSLVSSVQGDLISSIREQMLECKNFILQCDARSARARGPLVPEKVSSVNRGKLTGEMDSDKFMLNSLIKMTVCESELRDNSRSMSVLTIHPFYYAGVIVSYMVLVSSQFKLPESMAIRRFLIIVTWINVNAVAVSCAHVFSRIVGFERVMWLVLAAQANVSNQLALKQEQNNSSDRNIKHSSFEPGEEFRRSDSRNCTLVTDLWVKFVIATSLNIERYCARPFNVKLTYQTIIELNFFVIFIYSLSVELPDRK